MGLGTPVQMALKIPVAFQGLLGEGWLKYATGFLASFIHAAPFAAAAAGLSLCPLIVLAFPAF